MLILNQEQLKFADRYTIDNEPIASIDLMERASKACLPEIIIHTQSDVFVFCGKGNNGGDGLAITRLLNDKGILCKAVVVHQSETFSNDALINYNLLKENYPNCITDIHDEDGLETLSFSANTLIIDALFGTGLNKALTGLSAAAVNTINKSNCRIISIDCPSGLYVDKENAADDVIVRSMLTLTFQYPKLSFLFAQNEKYVPAFNILDIGLHPNLESYLQSPNVFLTRGLIKQIVKKRTKFSHKGHYGHALIIAGSDGMKGAALLSTKSCLRSGAGLTTLHSAEAVSEALTAYAPEAMICKDQHQQHISELPSLEKFASVGVGPGIGTHPDTAQVLKKLMHYHNGTPLVLDADALNILSENKTWLSFLPPETILTPHPKEFDRLSEKHHTDFERWLAAKQFAVKYKCILILKGAHSVVCMPDGSCYFNSSGNAGMAKGGSGDVLTGIITGLLARGYSVPKSALIGVFVHGYAADLAVNHSSMESLLADDVIEHLGMAFYEIEA